MELEDFQTVVDSHPVAHAFERAADHAGDDADDGGQPWLHIAGGRGDANEAGNDAFTRSLDGPLVTVLEV